MGNRIIKFRAWDKTHNEMILLDDVVKEMLMRQAIHDRWHPKQHNGHDYTDTKVFMQFTGLLDKNGKEIYEGDIIKAKYWHNNPPSKRPKQKFIEVNLPVVFEDGVFSLNDAAIRSTEYGTTFNQWYGDNAEIVGNIHEHPNLIHQTPDLL